MGYGGRGVHAKRLHSRRRHQNETGSSSRWHWSWKVAVAILVNGALIGGLLPYTLSSAGADPVPTQLVFTIQPGDGSPGSDLAAQPEVTIEDSSNDTVSTSSSITLTLTGPGGVPQTGYPATLSCDQSQDSLAASSGVAAFTGCAVDRGGLFTLTATDATDNLSVVSAEIFVSGPAQLAFTGEPGGGASGQAWSTQPQVTVEDAHGNAITTSTSSISLSVDPGTGQPGASLSCSTNPVAASGGVANFAGCSIDKASSDYQLVATDATDLLSASSSTFSISAGTAAQLAFTVEPTSSAGGSAFTGQPQVTVEDSGGNPIAGNTDQITLAITGGTGTTGAALSCSGNTVTAVNGVASFAGCSINLAGTGYTLTAKDSAASLTGTSAAIDVTAGTASQIAFTTEPSGGAGGVPFGTQPAVSLTDSGGNPVAGQVKLSIEPGTGTPGANLSCGANPLGVGAGGASFAGCSIGETGTGYVLVASSGALQTASLPFDVSGGAVAQASFSAEPGNGTGGSLLSAQPSVRLSDSGGNPAAGNVTLSLTPGLGTPGAKLSCSENTVAAVGGVATFSGCSVDQAGSGYTLTATAGPATAESSSFMVGVGAPAQLVFSVQPGGGKGGATWATQPTVVIEDAGGNQVSTDSSSISLSVTPGSGNGTLACDANALPAVLGSALFASCTIDKTASAYTLTASDSADGLSVVSAPFAVTVGPAARLAFTSQPSGSTAGTVWPGQPVVSVTDAGGNVVTTASSSIAISLTPGTGAPGALLSCPAYKVSASGGNAVFSGCFMTRAASDYTLTATDAADGLKAESQPFSILLAPPGPLGVAPTGIPVAQTFGGKMYGANPTEVTDDVNSATGALAFSLTDLKVAGIGEPLVIERSYNSDDTTGGSFGPGWSSIFDLSVQFAANHSTATVRGEDGQQLVFTWNTFFQSWIAPPGAKASLSCVLTTCTVTRFDGVSWQETNGLVRDYLAPDGQGFQFAYSPGQVTITLDTTNHSPLVVNAQLNSAGEVTKITSPTRQVSYGYSAGLLTSFTDADGNTWTYVYASGRLVSETDPLGKLRLAVTYDPTTGRVTSETQAGSPRHTDDTFTWNATTQTSTQWALSAVNGTLTREPYTDQYIGNVLVAQTDPSGAIMRYSYDSRVNLTEIQDPLGWVQSLSYDGANNLIAETTPISSTSAAVVHMSYDSQHRLISQTDADGNTTAYVYAGSELRYVQPPGVTPGTLHSYNSVGELVDVVTPLGQQVFTYDSAGNRTGVILETLGGQSLNGRGTLASYDEAGDMVTSVDPRGNLSSGINTAYETKWSYDADGNLMSETTPGPQTTTYTYDAADDLTEVQGPTGAVTSYSWNESTLTESTVTGPATTTDVYDPSGNLLSETDASKQTTTHVYDAAGREVATTEPNGVTVRYAYDLGGDAVDITDSAGNTITREFDSLGRPIRTVDDGAVSLTSYDPAGNVISTTDPDGAVVLTTYNALNKPASVINDVGKTSYGYDAAGDLISLTDPNGHITTWTYDAAGRQLSTTANGATTSYGYDLAGNVDSITDPDGRVTSYTLSPENQPTKTVYTWAGHTTETVTESYNAFGQRTQMVDPDGTVHNYTYDAAGNLTSASDGAENFTYNYATPGEVVETYPDGTQVTYAVDDAQNLMSVEAGQPGQADYAQASYIRNSNRETTGIAFSNGVLETDQLDATGNVLDQSLQVAGTAIANDAFTYDAAGNRLTQVDTVDGTTTTNQYGYDGAERLTSFSSTSAPAPAVTVSAARQLTLGQSTSPDYALTSDIVSQGATAPATTGTTSAQSPAEVALSDAPTPGAYAGSYATSATPGSLTATASVLAAPSSSAALFTATQTPASPSAPVATKTTSAKTSSHSDPSYAYDGDGNEVSYTSGSGTTLFTYNAEDEVASERGPGGITTWSYDRNGDVTKVVGPSSTQTYTYDAADHLVGVMTTAGANTTTVSYTYDGDGNRVSETAGSTVTKFVWDPFGQYPELALELNGSGGLIARFIYGDGPVAMETPTATYFYQLDPQGSVAEMTDASGNAVAAYHYDGYGNVTIAGTNPTGNSLMFQGQWLDANTGLYYMRARNYDPTTGRFTQRDPLMPVVGVPFVSPYVFALDRPTYFSDPSGQSITTTLFDSHSTTAANDTQDVKDGIVGLAVGLKAASKLGGFSSAVEAADLAGQVGIEVEPATASLAEAGEAVAVAGKFLSVAGIGLQTFITVDDCLHGTVQSCVADAVGTAINIGFTFGCSVLTAGVGAVACGIAGAAIGIGLSYVIGHYGPQIVAGLVSLADATAQGVSQLAVETAQGLTQAGEDAVGFAEQAGGAIATGFNEATTAISSGLDGALTTLVNAGYTAAQLAGVLAKTFNEGLDAVVSGLVSLGYNINAVAQALVSVFSTTAQEAAQIFKDAFNYTASAIAGVLQSVYNLGDQATAAILQAVNFGVDQVASALETVFNDTAQAAAGVLKALNYGIEQIGAVLQQVFGELDTLTASILAGLNYGVDLIAGVLNTIYNDADAAVAAALKFAGFAATVITSALVDVFNDGAQAVAFILKGLNFAVDEIATALNTVFSLAAQAAAQVLDDVGFAVDAVATALSDVFSLAAQAAATVLMAIGYAVDDVATALSDVFDAAVNTVASILDAIGFNVDAIATALEDVFNATAQVAADILKGIGIGINAIAIALSDVFGLAAEAAATILKAVGFAIDAIASALSAVFGELAQATAQILKDIGFAVSDIASALEDVFNAVASVVAQILTAIGAAVSDIANALETVFGEAANAIANLLSDLGWAASAIAAIGGAFASFGESVANCFESFFSDC